MANRNSSPSSPPMIYKTTLTLKDTSVQFTVVIGYIFTQGLNCFSIPFLNLLSFLPAVRCSVAVVSRFVFKR